MENEKNEEEKTVTMGAFIYPKGKGWGEGIHVLYSVTETQKKRINEIFKWKQEEGEECRLSTIITAVKKGEM